METFSTNKSYWHHLIFMSHEDYKTNISTLATSDPDFHVKVKESLLISRDEPILNKK